MSMSTTDQRKELKRPICQPHSPSTHHMATHLSTYNHSSKILSQTLKPRLKLLKLLKLPIPIPIPRLPPRILRRKQHITHRMQYPIARNGIHNLHTQEPINPNINQTAPPLNINTQTLLPQERRQINMEIWTGCPPSSFPHPILTVVMHEISIRVHGMVSNDMILHQRLQQPLPSLREKEGIDNRPKFRERSVRGREHCAADMGVRQHFIETALQQREREG